MQGAAPPAGTGRAASASAAPALLDLAKGHPDHTLLPREALAEACAAAADSLSSGSTDGLRYGSRPEGSGSFLEELAAFLCRQCPGEAAARTDGLLLTNGVSHGLELACSVFSQPGEAVLVEAPTYFLAIGIFRSRGLEILPVATDADGMLVEAAEAVLDARPPGSPPVRFIYTVPAGHNPTGGTLPSARRQALVALARRRGLLVLADEVYHLLSWHGPLQRPPRMACFDEAYAGRVARQEPAPAQVDEDDDPAYKDTPVVAEGPATSSPRRSEPSAGAPPSDPVVISVSSFTKILAPGLRVGWVEAAPALIARMAAAGYLVSGGCVATFATDAVLGHTLSSRSADAALARLVAEYRSRAGCLLAALERAGLPPLVRPCAGYFVWVPLGADAKEVLDVARAKHGVSFMPGARCDVSESPGLASCARLCFAWLPAADLEEGVDRLGRAVAEVASRRGQFAAG